MTAATEPATASDRAEWVLLGIPASVAEARALLAEWLTGRYPGRLVDDAVMVLSELVSNAIRHTGSHRVGVLCALSAGRLRIAVSDHSRELPVRITDVTCDRDESGRGLLIVEAFCVRWGATVEVLGKTVWAELHAGHPRPTPVANRP